MSKAQHKHNVENQLTASKAAWHKDWRTWTVVALMLLAMATYIMTLDESEGPDGTPDQTQEPISAM
jgi:hypothetical protein